jgi:hypothetical protein
MMDPIDILLVDLQDVGTRVYTFIYTLAHCMEAARQYGKKIIVLDRPNPLGGVQVEGNLLVSDCSSFVGRYPIPMRHGLTIGELALLFNTRFGIGCDLDVIAMQGWKREMTFGQTGLPWVAPSPNLPTPTSAMVYPGQVIWEGTNISEGRGTTQPFELFGAPFIAPEHLIKGIDRAFLSGVVLRPVEFEPTSNKWAGHPCKGFQIHVTDPDTYSPYALSLCLYQAIYQMYPNRFAYKQPPYEYEYQTPSHGLDIGGRTDPIRDRSRYAIAGHHFWMDGTDGRLHEAVQAHPPLRMMQSSQQADGYPIRTGQANTIIQGLANRTRNAAISRRRCHGPRDNSLSAKTYLTIRNTWVC